MSAHGIATQGYRLILKDQEVELYDLKHDPRGLVNIAEQNEALVEELTTLLISGPNPNWEPDL